ncbi:NADP-dependent oxidoreductase [Georgenia yuyongxinii]
MSQAYVFHAYGGPETQEHVERPVPAPAAGELLVQVRAAGVTPLDVAHRGGRLGRDDALPAPLGHEVAGIVAAVGDGVDAFAAGDEILAAPAPGHGGLAQHTIVRAADAVAKPAEISFADAATIPVTAATAYDLTHQVELEPGQRLLILGAGSGAGLMAAQIGKVHQFAVLGVAAVDQREIVESTGATFVPAGPDLAARLRQVAPDGVDLLADLIGGDTLRAAAGLVTDPARILSAVDPATAAELGGAALERSAEATAKITGVIQYGLVDPHVTALYPLDRAGEALAAVEAGHVTGTVVVEVMA